MTTKPTTKHKRCSAPFPHAGGSWVYAAGKLEREAAPVVATEATPDVAPPSDAESGKHGKRIGR